MKQNRTVEIDGIEYRATLVICDGCSSPIKIGTEPMLVDQSCLTLIHANAGKPQDEIIHQANEPGGYFDHYCHECVVAGKIPRMTAEEIKNYQKALERQKELYPSLFEAPIAAAVTP